MDESESTSSQFVLGIDGGGAKTVCIILDKSAKVIAEGRAGSTNRNSVGDEHARANLEKAISEALIAASCSPQQIGAICVGIAGMDRPPERATISAWLEGILPGTPVILHNDALIALASGTGGDLFGAVVVSGTGMIVYGIDRNGQTKRAGGWGPLFGDKGSGYALGMAALTAIANAVDGIGPATALEGALLDYLDLSTPQGLIGWAYSDPSWARIAELAPLVIECAKQNDHVAQTIVEEAAVDLAAMVEVVVRGLNLLNTAIPIVLSGGNLQPGFFYNLVCQHLHHLTSNAQLLRPSFEPAVGAALLALRQL